MNEQDLENERMELINDLIAISQIMDDYYRFHPENSNKIDLVAEYNNLDEMRKKIELDLDRISE